MGELACTEMCISFLNRMPRSCRITFLISRILAICTFWCTTAQLFGVSSYSFLFTEAVESIKQSCSFISVTMEAMV